MTGLLVVRSCCKKLRFQLLVIAFMLILASMILGISAVLLLDYQENYFETHERLRGEHVVLNYASYMGTGENYIQDQLSKDSRILDYETKAVSFGKGSCEYGEGGLLTTVFSFMKMSDGESKTIGKFEITEEIEEGEGYIPYIFKANGFYQTGDSFTVTVDGTEKSFIIKGFYNNVTTGTVNCRDVVLLLSDEKYEELTAENLIPGYRVSVRLTEPREAEHLESEIIELLSDAGSGITLVDATNYLKLSRVRYISETIFAGILCGAAAIIVLVLLAIVAVSLSNYIKENMRALGIMKAVGYESRKLIGPVILFLTLLSVLCSLAGYGLSYVLLPTVNQVLESQSGIPYQIHFLWVPGALTLGVMLLSVLLTAFFSLVKIRTILPIMAIRPVKNQGKALHALPLSGVKTGLNLTLGLKTVLSNRKKYLVFLVASCFITVMLCVAAYCVDNILNHPENIVRMVMGNTADISLSVSASEEEGLKEWLSAREEVENFYVYTHSSACHEGGDRLDVVIRDSEGTRQSEYLITEGILPKEENEIAVNFAYGEEKGLRIGDEMVLLKDGVRQSYLLCGFFQDAISSGKNVALSRAGYERLSALSSISYLINLQEGNDIDAFMDELSSFDSVSAINHREFVSGLSGTYVSMLNALITIIVIISLFIAAMVLSVIVNMILFNKRREHGIMKSLGFVTSQIVFQTALSFVPVAVCGSVVGLLISGKGVSTLFSSFVRSIGISSFGDSVSFPYLLSCGLLFTVFTFAVTCLLSLKVRKTVPHDLFNNE